MACKYIFNNTTYSSKEEFIKEVLKKDFLNQPKTLRVQEIQQPDFLKNIRKDKDYLKSLGLSEEQQSFLNLLFGDNEKWVKFFVSSLIQNAAKNGYSKIWLPTGNTSAKVEGHTTLEEFKKQKEDRIKQLEETKTNNSLRPVPEEININEPQVNLSVDQEITQLKEELERVEREGFAALRPIYNFYENTVTNILNKTYGKENVKLITDEYGNTWNEITITPKMSETIRLNTPNGKIEYTGDLAIEEKIAEEAYNSKDENISTTLIGKFIQSIKNLFRNIFYEKDNISRLIRKLNQGGFKLNNQKTNTTNLPYRYSITPIETENDIQLPIESIPYENSNETKYDEELINRVTEAQNNIEGILQSYQTINNLSYQNFHNSKIIPDNIQSLVTQTLEKEYPEHSKYSKDFNFIPYATLLAEQYAKNDPKFYYIKNELLNYIIELYPNINADLNKKVISLIHNGDSFHFDTDFKNVFKAKQLHPDTVNIKDYNLDRNNVNELIEKYFSTDEKEIDFDLELNNGLYQSNLEKRLNELSNSNITLEEVLRENNHENYIPLFQPTDLNKSIKELHTVYENGYMIIDHLINSVAKPMIKIEPLSIEDSTDEIKQLFENKGVKQHRFGILFNDNLIGEFSYYKEGDKINVLHSVINELPSYLKQVDKVSKAVNIDFSQKENLDYLVENIDSNIRTKDIDYKKPLIFKNSLDAYSQYLLQNPNSNIEQFKSWIKELNNEKIDKNQNAKNLFVSEFTSALTKIFRNVKVLPKEDFQKELSIQNSINFEGHNFTANLVFNKQDKSFENFLNNSPYKSILDFNKTEDVWIAKVLNLLYQQRKIKKELKNRKEIDNYLKEIYKEMFLEENINKYILTDFSDQYIEYMASIDNTNLESRQIFQAIQKDPSIKPKLVEELQEQHKQNLLHYKKGIDSDINYSLAFKIILFNSILNYNIVVKEVNGELEYSKSKRGKNTTKSFDELGEGVISLLNTKEYAESANSFLNSYIDFLINFKPDTKNLLKQAEPFIHQKTENGIWYKFDDSENEEMIDVASKFGSTTIGQLSSWCTSNISTAKGYISKGALYIYYSFNEKIATIQINVDKNDTAIEIGGNNKGQAIYERDIPNLSKFINDNKNLNLRSLDDYNFYSKILSEVKKGIKNINDYNDNDILRLIEISKNEKDNTNDLKNLKNSVSNEKIAKIYNVTIDKVYRDSSILEIKDLNGLIFVGTDLDLGDNNQIKDLNGFTFNGTYLNLGNNNQIKDLNGLIFVGTNLDLGDNNQIKDLNGFTFNGNILYLGNNNQIKDLNGFTFNGTYLNLGNNNQIKDLNGFTFNKDKSKIFNINNIINDNTLYGQDINDINNIPFSKNDNNDIQGFYNRDTDEIVINGDSLNPDKIIYHELVHRFFNNLDRNSELYKVIQPKLKELIDFIKQDTELLEKLKKQYNSYEINEELIANYIADIIDNKLSIISDKTILDKINDIINSVIEFIKKSGSLYNLTNEEIKNLTVEEFADKLGNTVLKDINKITKKNEFIEEYVDEKQIENLDALISNIDSNLTTTIHEKAHEYEKVLTINEILTLESWSGYKKGTKEFSEAFAVGAEKYIYDGAVSEDPKLNEIFRQFKIWFKGLIRNAVNYFKDINELNDEVKAIYQEMMSSENRGKNLRDKSDFKQYLKENQRTLVRDSIKQHAAKIGMKYVEMENRVYDMGELQFQNMNDFVKGFKMDEETKEVFKYLEENHLDRLNKIQIIETNQEIPAYYKDSKIYINTNLIKEISIANELLQLLTLDIINNPTNDADTNFVDNLKELYDKFKREKKDREFNYITNINEFLTYTLTNNKMQQYLSKINEPLINNIIYFIKSFFNIQYDSILNDIFNSNKQVIRKNDNILFQKDPIKDLAIRYNMNTSGFMPSHINPIAVKNEIRNKGLNIELKQADRGGGYYFIREGRFYNPFKFTKQIEGGYTEIDVLKDFSNNLSERFNIEVKLITMTEAEKLIDNYNGESSFYNTENQTAYLVIDRADETSAIHEIFTHPFLILIEKHNTELYNNLLNEAKSNKEVVQYVIDNYGKIIDHEIIARYIDLETRGELNRKNTIIDYIKDFYNNLSSYLKSLFNLKEVTIEQLSPNITLKELTQLILNSRIKIDLKREVSNKVNNFEDLKEVDKFWNQFNDYEIQQFLNHKFPNNRLVYRTDNNGLNHFNYSTNPNLKFGNGIYLTSDLNYTKDNSKNKTVYPVLLNSNNILEFNNKIDYYNDVASYFNKNTVPTKEEQNRYIEEKHKEGYSIYIKNSGIIDEVVTTNDNIVILNTESIHNEMLKFNNDNNNFNPEDGIKIKHCK